MSTATLLNSWSRLDVKYVAKKSSCPPQSHRFSTKLPRKRTLECCTSSVGFSCAVPRAAKLAKMMDRMDVFPALDDPMSSTFFR